MSKAKDSAPKPMTKGRVLHWVIVAAFFLTFTTGLILFVPISALAEGGYSRLLHRAGVIVLLVAPVLYALIDYRSAKAWLQEALFWTKRASRQSNRWKRTHKTLIVAGYVAFALSGFVLWFLTTNDLGTLYQVSVRSHDIAFIVAGFVLTYHMYFELDWWLWKRRYCHKCDSVRCAESCPNRAMIRQPDGYLEYHPERCNNCRECMDECRRHMYYSELDQEQKKARTT